MIKRIYHYEPSTDSELVIGIFELLPDGTVRTEYPNAEQTGFDRSIADGRVRDRGLRGRLVFPRDGKVFFDALDGAFGMSSLIRIETIP